MVNKRYLKLCILFLGTGFTIYWCNRLWSFSRYAWRQSYADFTISRIQDRGSDDNATKPRLQTAIPKIIHQTWKTDVIPTQWMATRASCRRLYREFKHILWTDKTIRDLITSTYPWFLKTYDSYPYDIQRVDAARYFILDSYGGIYLDMDVGCVNSIRKVLLNYPFILPITEPVGISNDVLISIPHHPFIQEVISQLKEWNVGCGSPYFTVFFSTGPAFLSYQAGRYLEKQSALEGDGISESQEVIYFLAHDIYASGVFYHITGNSWHYGDAKILSFIYYNLYTVMVLGISLCTILWCYIKSDCKSMIFRFLKIISDRKKRHASRDKGG